MSSVEFIGPSRGSALDFEPFITLPEQVPSIVELGRLDEMQSALEALFGVDPRNTFASFQEPEKFSLQRLFRRTILDYFNIDEAISRIDNHDKEEEKLLDFLWKLVELNNLLEDIRNKMCSLVKS
jgi:hypothetical protein